jgi:hypothetical protein
LISLIYKDIIGSNKILRYFAKKQKTKTMKCIILTLTFLINFTLLFGQNSQVNVGFSKDKSSYGLGDRGPIIKEVQKCFGFPATSQTGIFDSKTEKKLQELYGCSSINSYTYERIKEKCKVYFGTIATTKSIKNEGVYNLYHDAVVIDAFDFFETKQFIYKGAPFNGSVFFVNEDSEYFKKYNKYPVFDSLSISKIDFNSNPISKILIVTDGKVDSFSFSNITFYTNGLVSSTRYYDNSRLRTEKKILNHSKREFQKNEYFNDGKLSYAGIIHNKKWLSTSHDIEDSPFEVYYPNGSLKKQGYFGDKNKKESYFITKEFRENGDLAELYKYSGIKRPGSLDFRNDDYIKEEYLNNILTSKTIVENQNKVSTFDYYSSGSIKKEYFSNGQLKKEYNENGLVLAEYNRDGKSINKTDSQKPQIIKNTQIKQEPGILKSTESHKCNYCHSIFNGKGYYLSWYDGGFHMNRSSDDNQELCCSSECANKIME